MQLDGEPELVAADHVEQVLQHDALAVEPQLVAEVEHAQVALHLALVVEERRVAAVAGRERLDVLRDLALEELLGLGPGQRELAALGAVDEAAALSQDRVLAGDVGRRYHSLLIVEPGAAHQPALDLALELLEHHGVRDAGRHRGAHDRGLLGAVELREQPEQAVDAHAARLAQQLVGVGGDRRIGHGRYPPTRIMALAETFQEIVDSLPSDWTDMELDLRVDESRYVDAALLVLTVNAQPYSKHDWHWRLLVAHQFGHAAAAPAVHGTLRLLDEAGIRGELALRELRTGRVETVQMWGRPESVRQEFRRIRAQ